MAYSPVQYANGCKMGLQVISSADYQWINIVYHSIMTTLCFSTEERNVQQLIDVLAFRGFNQIF